MECQKINRVSVIHRIENGWNHPFLFMHHTALSTHLCCLFCLCLLDTVEAESNCCHCEEFKFRKITQNLSSEVEGFTCDPLLIPVCLCVCLQISSP